MTSVKASMSIHAGIKIPGWLLFVYLLYSQAIPAIHYEWGVKMGTQDSPEKVTEVGTSFWYGFAFGDLVCYIPLLGIGLFSHDKPLGKAALTAALGITVYWPIVCLTAAVTARNAPGWHLDKSDEAQFWVALPIIAVWALWSLRCVSNQVPLKCG